MLYPYKFTPLYFTKMWGGTAIADKFNRQLPPGKIGEAWEIADHEHGESIVENGSLAGATIQDLIHKLGPAFYGKNIGSLPRGRFPLLLKTIDANDKLSVQVHPADDFAYQMEKETGKTEMWYVLDAKPGAQLVVGLKPGTTKETLAEAVKKGTCEELLNFVQVKSGDIIHIPAGLVHAMGEGVLIAEMQQNSDSTYRLYDYNRLDDFGHPRDLHIEKALEVSFFPEKPYQVKNEPLLLSETAAFRRRILDACRYFVVEELEISTSFSADLTGEHFIIIYTTDGQGEIQSSGRTQVRFSANDCLLLPASLGKYLIKGSCKLMISYPPVSLTKQVSNLQKLGYSYEEILGIGGPGFANELLR